jgi:hypothetical protein
MRTGRKWQVGVVCVVLMALLTPAALAVDFAGGGEFTVDYALEPENVAWVYETSQALGFVPFAGNRALNQYVEVSK